MKLTEWLRERRQRNAHRRYLAERERQQALEGRDTQKAIRDAARGWAAGGQGTSGNT